MDQRGGVVGPWVHVQRGHRDRLDAIFVPPSWISFLVDKENARRPARRCSRPSTSGCALPEAKRPKLVVFGESLRILRRRAPFLSLNNLVARTNGALFSGPTFNNTIWTDLTRNRDTGSPMWLPIYDEGYNARFVARPENLDRPGEAVGRRARRVPPARVGPDRVVDTGSAVPRTGLAAGSRAATTCRPG